jgi:hypothetical protein
MLSDSSKPMKRDNGFDCQERIKIIYKKKAFGMANVGIISHEVDNISNWLYYKAIWLLRYY